MKMSGQTQSKLLQNKLILTEGGNDYRGKQELLFLNASDVNKRLKPGLGIHHTNRNTFHLVKWEHRLPFFFLNAVINHNNKGRSLSGRWQEVQRCKFIRCSLNVTDAVRNDEDSDAGLLTSEDTH